MNEADRWVLMEAEDCITPHGPPLPQLETTLILRAWSSLGKQGSVCTDVRSPFGESVPEFAGSDWDSLSETFALLCREDGCVPNWDAPVEKLVGDTKVVPGREPRCLAMSTRVFVAAMFAGDEWVAEKFGRPSMRKETQ